MTRDKRFVGVNGKGTAGPSRIRAARAYQIPNGAWGDIHCDLVAVAGRPGPGKRGEVRGVLTVAAARRPDVTFRIGELLSKNDGDITSCIGMECGGIIGHVYWFTAGKRQFAAIKKEIRMRKIDSITPGKSGPNMIPFAWTIRGRNRKGIFRDVGQVLSSRGIIITSTHCETMSIPIGGDGHTVSIFQMSVKTDVPPEQLAEIGKLLDELEALGGSDFWEVIEPIDLRTGKPIGQTGKPIGRKKRAGRKAGSGITG